MAQGYYYDGTPIGGAVSTPTTSNGFTPGYAANAKGQTAYYTSPGNSVGKDSVFDPLSKNYNATVANSNGKISLSDLNSSTPNGLSSSYNGTNGSGNPAVNGGFSGGNAGGIGISQPSYGVSGGGGGTYGVSSTPQSTSSIQDQINSLKQAQIDAAVSALGKSRDASLSNLTAEKSAIAPQYYDKRNAESTSNQLGQKNFAEFLAARGQTNSGVANQGAIASNVSLQGGLNSLNTQEMTANVDNARRVTGINNAYESDIVGAKSGAEATALQNLISQQNLDRTFNAGQATAAQQLALQRAGLTGTLDGVQTIGGKTADANIAQSTASTNLSNAQLMEITNPNSVTNQLAKLNLDTSTLKYAQLPAQLQAEAQKIGQDLQLGQINLSVAQQKLNFLPQQMQAELGLTAAQTGSANRANTGGSGGVSTAQQNINNKKDTTSATNDAFSVLNNLANQGKSRTEVLNYLNQHSSDFVGADYDSLLSRAQKAFTWDKNSSGTWFNTTAKKDPNE